MPMDFKQIEELLAKYWNCDTSVEEEQVLREYFAASANDGGMKELAAMFQYFDRQRRKEMQYPALGIRMRDIVRPKQARLRRLVHNSIRIAAGVVVLMVAVWFVRSEIRQSTPQELVDTYSDPELAFEETKKALIMISRSFGAAEEQAKKINLFNEAQQQIQSPEVASEEGIAQ